MKRLPLLFFLALLASTVFGQAAEICDDGIDNDGDGLIDCYDPDCISFAKCNGSFTNKDALCQAIPSTVPSFSILLSTPTPDKTTTHLSRIAIGDLDQDGIPEIVSVNRVTKKLFYINGRTQAIENGGGSGFDIKFDAVYDMAIANINVNNTPTDNCAEVFLAGVDDGDGNTYFYAYNCSSSSPIWRSSDALPQDPVNYGLADFDGDGNPELYAKDVIFDAKTGTQIVASTNWGNMNGGPIAVDMNAALGLPSDNGKLELVSGLNIYSVNLGGRTHNSGSLSLLKNYPTYVIKNSVVTSGVNFNATSVADFNQDGYMDIIASGGLINASGKNITTVYFWDVHANTVKTFSDPFGSSDYQYGWKNGTGRVNIADLDGDGKLNVSFVSGAYLYALKEDFSLYWRKDVFEQTSGFTGCTLFDFNGDGASEVVYRDEQNLYIVNGNDGSTYTSLPCVSRTHREYPIVADVDADGSTEICVPCRTTDFFPGTTLVKGVPTSNDLINFNDINQSQYSQVRIYKSNLALSPPWVPARRLWNQHGYFVVNINDDLTIPKIQQSQLAVFAPTNCIAPGKTTPNPGPNRPLNSFLNQSPYLNSKGCPTYASPDLAYVQNSLSVTPPTCPNKDFTVSFSITNKGDNQLDGVVPVTFYSGDPTKAGAVKLNTIYPTLKAFAPKAVYSVTNATVNGLGFAFTLYIVLNDAGTSVPTPIVLPNTNFVECDYGNNIISAPVNPKSVSLTAVKISDDLKCVGSSSPDNGAVQAYVPTGATQNTADYTFYWSKGSTGKSIATADYVGAVYSGLAPGAYTVYAVHKTALCNSDTVTVNVGQVNNSVTVGISLVSGVTNCAKPNGQLKAIADNGTLPSSNFSFAWYEGNDIFTSPQVGVSDVATDLKSLTYTVLVTDNTTGCQTVESFNVPSNIVTPVVSTTSVDITCSSSNSGSASANVGGVTSGFTFSWYNGSSVKSGAADFTGVTYSGLAAGTYTVVATNNTSGCPSNPLTVTIKQTTPPTASISAMANQTSCDPSQPNGSATVGISGGTGPYLTEWFKGQNTLAANKFATTTTVSNLDVGTYTVKVTDNATGCSSTAEATITLQLGPQVTITTTAASQTQCSPYNGSITAHVSSGNVSDYIFSWYNGSSAKATPDYAQTGNVLNTLQSGTYTVAAVNKITHCLATNKTSIVVNASPSITMTLNSTITFYPSDCTTPTGVMAVDVSAPGNTLGFKVEWYTGGLPLTSPPFFTETKPMTSTASGLLAGVYTAVATDLNSGCTSSKTFNLPFKDAPVLTYITQTDISNCVPGNNGNIKVSLKPTPIPGFDNTTYDIYVYPGTNDPGSPVGAIATLAGSTGILEPTATPPLPYSLYDFTTPSILTPQSYTLVAVTKSSAGQFAGCRSIPVIAEIKQNTTNPVVTASSIGQNTNCTGVTGNGSITLTPTANTSYEWFTGSTASGTTISTASGISNLSPGNYTVRATTTTSPSNGCQSLSTFTVPNNPTTVSIDASVLATQDLVLCNGAVLNIGSATISSIKENGTNVALTNYTFAWTDASGGSLPGSTNTESNLAAGTYFVTATNTTSGCFSDRQFIINQVSISNSVSATTVDAICSVANSGSASATVGGATSGYTFKWYKGNTVTTNPPDFTGSTYANLTPGNYTVIATTASGCVSNPATVTIKQTSPPTVAASVVANQTSCDTSLPNGSVSAIANGGSGSYQYEWFKGQNTLVANKIASVASVSSLDVGIYTIKVTDNVTGCSSTDQATIVLQLGPQVTISTSVVSQTQCTPYNGSITALVSSGNPSDYTFSWYNGKTVKATPDYAQTGNVLNTLQSGTYTVAAVNNITHCLATNQTSIVIDASPTITISLNSTITFYPTNCHDGHGVMAVDISSVGNTLGFKTDWYAGRSPYRAPSFYSEVVLATSTASGLVAGVYSAVATDLNSGCQAAKSFNLPFLDAPELHYVSQQNVDNCVPGNDGSIEVDLKPTPTFSNTDYNIYIYAGTSDPGSGAGFLPFLNGATGIARVDTVGLYQFITPSQLSPQFYTLVAVTNKPGDINFDGCRSIPVVVEIIQDTNNPIITANSIAQNTNCMGVAGNGSIALNLTPSTSYEWFSGSSASGPVISTSGTLSNQLAGPYTVKATTTSPVSNGCQSLLTVNIPNNPVIVAISGSGLTKRNLLNCNSVSGVALNNGSATITTISENGSSIPAPGSYTFSWSDGSGASLPGNTNQENNLAAGTYYVTATNPSTGCSTDLQFAISDQTTGTISVNLTDYQSPQLCAVATNGELTVLASGGSTSGYSYRWFPGTDTTGVAIVPSPDASDLQNIVAPPGGPASVQYTVKAINNDNHCFAIGTYTLPITINPVLTTVSSSSPVTSCSMDNGIIFGTVINDASSNYTYSWTSGTGQTYTGKQVNNLGAGIYTLIATDTRNAICVSQPAPVSLVDQKVIPVVTAAQSSPLTNCDPTKLNGEADASVNGDAIHYTFNWYVGNAVTGSPFYTGSDAGGLADGTYTVTATDNVTGCTGTTQVIVQKNLTTIPTPQIKVLSNVTSCLLSNGSLTASVGGDTKDYIFNWYIGNTPKTTADYTGETVNDVDVGFYTVTATDRASGCISGPDTDQIIKDQIFPDFDFKINGASCGKNNGSAVLTVTNGALVESIIWDNNGTPVYGPGLSQIPAGAYEVTVTTQLGCAISKTIQIMTDINPFNGVSQNNDGKNDKFVIDCIDNFPNNNVKIFNRAGTIVYESDGYNNLDTYFDGRSNRGISPMGVVLPDGTYYYIIDKKDGSKQMAGYLELVH